MTKKELITFTTKQCYDFMIAYGYYKKCDLCMKKKLEKQLINDPESVQAVLLNHLYNNRKSNDPGHKEAKYLLFLIDDQLLKSKHAVL